MDVLPVAVDPPGIIQFRAKRSSGIRTRDLPAEPGSTSIPAGTATSHGWLTPPKPQQRGTMLFDRRPYYVVGFVAGLLLVALIWMSPKTTPEQKVAHDVAILAKEPWDSVRVMDIRFEGPAESPTDVFVRGERPDGTPVLVQFAPDTPYTARSAVERLRGRDPDHMAEILMVPRSLVVSAFRSRFRRDATHAGIAYFGGVTLQEPGAEGDMAPVDAESSMPYSEEDGPDAGSMAPASTDG